MGRDKIKVEYDVVPNGHNGDSIWCYDNLPEALYYATKELGHDSIIYCQVDHTLANGDRSLYTAFEIVVTWGNDLTPISVVNAIFGIAP